MKKVLFMILMLAPVVAMAQKFGHVNSQEVIKAMPNTPRRRQRLRLWHNSMRLTSRACRKR